MVLNLTSEVRNAFQDLRKSRTPFHTIILTPDVENLSVILVENATEGIPFDDLSKKLPPDSPRIIISMPERVHPDGRKSYPIIMVAYCPNNLSPQVNIVYSNARTQIVREFQIQHVWEVKKKYSVNMEALQEKFDTNKW